MYKNKNYFKGKVVLDVGCGTGTFQGIIIIGRVEPMQLPIIIILNIIIYYFEHRLDRVPFFDRSQCCGFMIGHITVGS